MIIMAAAKYVDKRKNVSLIRILHFIRCSVILNHAGFAYLGNFRGIDSYCFFKTSKFKLCTHAI